jgi:hypothetical protein
VPGHPFRTGFDLTLRPERILQRRTRQPTSETFRRLVEIGLKAKRKMADPDEQMPPPTCMGCGGLQRNLIAVERLNTRAYVLRIFRCPAESCRAAADLGGLF